MMEHDSSATEAASGKFCIILTSATRDNRVSYLIFIVDFSCGDVDFVGGRLANPTLLIDYGDSGKNNYSNGFSVIGKTLYMFEGDGGGNDKISKSSYSIDLSSIDTNTKLDKSNLLKVSEMRYPKWYPVAIPTPDGEKIVVFSSQFCMPGKFELYTPSRGEWEQLPSINLSTPSVMYVGQYGFVGNSDLLVQLYGSGRFVLDFNELNRGWVEECLSLSPGSGPFFCGSGRFFVVEEDQFCFTDSGAYDLKLEHEHGFPLPSFEELQSPEQVEELVSREPWFDNSVALVSNDSGEVTFGFLQIRLLLGRVPVYSDVIINLCCADLNEYKALCPADLNAETQSEIKMRIVKTQIFLCP